MEATQEKLQEIANKVAEQVHNKTPLPERKRLLASALSEAGFKVSDGGEKPHRGAAFFVKKMADNTYQINYRCGYSNWNYAPVLVVS